MVFLFCKHCGMAMDERSRFCPNCGAEKSEGQALSLTLPKGITKVEISFTEDWNEEENEASEEKNIRKAENEMYLRRFNIPEEKYLEALKITVELGTVSISILQRRLSVGYPTAGKIIEWMEQCGFISSFSGQSSRKVYLTEEELSKLLESWQGDN